MFSNNSEFEEQHIAEPAVWEDVEVDVWLDKKNYMINLAINSSSTCFVVVNGKTGTAVQVDSGDIFLENMRIFVTAIEQHEVTKDTDKLTKHVAVILAVQESMEKGTEVKILN